MQFLLGSALAVLMTCSNAQNNQLPTINFSTVFPHLVWLSSQGRDEAYPQGFQYKLISVRKPESQTVEFALIREVTGGQKVTALHAQGPAGKFEESIKRRLDSLGQQFGVTFERFDLRDVQNAEQFNARIASFGWRSDPLQN